MKMNGDVIVSVSFLDFTMVTLHSSQTSAIFLLLVEILPIAQPSPSLTQSFCNNGKLVPVYWHK